MRILLYKCIVFFSLISPLVCFSQNLPVYLPSNGLVAWYPFNGNANDESGNGNDGTINGATLTSDRNGNANSAYTFNGTSSYIIGSSGYFPTEERTVSIWFYSDNVGVGYSGRALFGYGGQSCGQSWNMTLDNAGNPNGQNSYEVQAHCNVFSITYNYGTNIPINQWHNWIISTSLSGTKFFIDGVLMSSNGTFINNTVAVSKNYTIGCYTNTNGIGPKLDDVNNTPWSGFLDDIAIYNRALTQEEITALYTGTPVNNNGGNTTSNAVPPGIPYQAVVRNASGQVAANTAATTKFTLHQNTTDGAVEYQETHALTTNAQGLVSAVIGQGTAVQGTFASINWSNTTKFLQVEVDLGNGYVDLGTQQLMSVPFALYAANAPAGPEGPQGPAGNDGQDGQNGQDGSSISSVVIQNNHLMVTLSNGTVMDAGAVLTEGCTNSAACNYSSSAFYDNGTCLIVGQVCDDGNSNTINDVINGECICAGFTLINGIYAIGNGVTDVDGNFYPSIIINGQEWMQQNLSVTKYRNGDPIPTGLNDISWSATANGAYSIYNEDGANNTLYGKLYNWYAVNDSRGLCPSGWHVPSDGLWTSLENFLGGNAVASGKMKTIDGWITPNVGATNESGFSSKPGGLRSTSGSFGAGGVDGYWWSADQSAAASAWYRIMVFGNAGIGRGSGDKHFGFSVRCVRD